MSEIQDDRFWGKFLGGNENEHESQEINNAATRKDKDNEQQELWGATPDWLTSFMQTVGGI